MYLIGTMPKFNGRENERGFYNFVQSVLIAPLNQPQGIGSWWRKFRVYDLFFYYAFFS